MRPLTLLVGAVRTAQRGRLFTAVVVISTAIGIAGCSLAFSIVEAASFHPAVYAKPEQLVVVMETSSMECRDCVDSFSPLTFERWKQRQLRSFSSLSAYEALSLEVERGTEHLALSGDRVGAEFFSTLGVHALAGRLIVAQDDRSDAAPVALVSNETWQRAFGGREDVLGSTLRIGDIIYSVVGVLPRGFSYPEGTQIWISKAGSRPSNTEQRTLGAVGRLKPGVSAEVALKELQADARQSEISSPASQGGRGVFVRPLQETSDSEHSEYWILVGAVAFAFLIACLNVASLYVVRSLTREREIAIRIALGAQAKHIATQLIAESVLLTTVGGAVGILLAMRMLHFASNLAALRLGIPVSLRLDGGILLAALLLSLAVGLGFGAAPTIQLFRVDHGTVLRSTARGVSQGRGHRKFRQTFVIGEVAVVIALASGAMLFTSSYLTATRYDLGFAADELLVARFALPRDKYDSRERLEQVGQTFATQLDLIRGSLGSAIWSTHFLPLKYSGARLIEAPLTVEGYGEVLSDRAVPLLSLDVTPGSLRTLGIHIVSGRDFETADGASAPPVVMVNEVAAKLYWPGENPLGKQLKLGPSTSSEPWLTVIAVTDSRVLTSSLGLTMALINPDRNWPQIFQPFAQAATRNVSIAVRGKTPEHLAGPLRHVVDDVIEGSGHVEYGTMRNLMLQSWQLPALQLKASFLSGLAAVGTALAILGIYALVSDSVLRRTNEIGIRIALGARNHHLLWLVIREAVGVAFIGILGGLSITLVLVRFASHYLFGITRGVKTGLLFGVSPTNPLLYLILSIAIILVIVIASVLPARRALGVDPVISLRAE